MKRESCPRVVLLRPLSTSWSFGVYWEMKISFSRVGVSIALLGLAALQWAGLNWYFDEKVFQADMELPLFVAFLM